MTKLKIKITKEILEQSRNCQQKTKSCAFATAIRDVFPTAAVHYHGIILNRSEFLNYLSMIGKDGAFPHELIANKIAIATSFEMKEFINKFDYSAPEQVINFPEQEFELELPDWVIEKYFSVDSIKLLENHPSLQLINS